MTLVLLAAAGLAVGGPALGLALIIIGAARSWARRRPVRHPVPVRALLLVLLVELRAGRSTLAALQGAAALFPESAELTVTARVATVSGITAAVGEAKGSLHGVLAQLARAQRSGAPLADTVRSMLESDIAAERARRVEKARALPVRLMVPISLLVLPGLVLLLYAPSLLRTFADLAGPLS